MHVEPEVVERGQTIVAGLDYYGNPTKDAPGWSNENEIGKLWSRFDRVWGQHKNAVQAVAPGIGYELHVGPKESDAYSIMVGVEVATVDHLPLELCARVLPSCTYATFTLKMSEVGSDWQERFFGEWLPNSPYELACDALIECYDERRFKGMGDPDSEIDILVPVRLRQPATGGG